MNQVNIFEREAPRNEEPNDYKHVHREIEGQKKKCMTSFLFS